MADAIVKFKIKDLGVTDTQFKGMVFGRQLEYIRKIQVFKETAKSTHLNQKRQTYTKAIREFVKLNDVTEYYCRFFSGKDYFDDSFEFFYKN